MAQSARTKSEFQRSLSQLLERDNGDCKVLFATYEKAEICVENDTFIKELAMEFDPNFSNQVKQSISDLKTVDRPILVIGETSAGKSSFLNLLIGRKVLPEMAAPCTHSICCIKKGETLQARVSSMDGSAPSEIISGDGMTDGEFSKKLAGFMNEENCAMSDNRRIDVFVESETLEDNIYLVDTPGFGDTAQMTQLLVRYLPNAIGIIFIINPTVAFGLSDDRAAVILAEIKELIDKRKIPSFDPCNILFLANKWDQIKKGEAKSLLQKIVEKMKTNWPWFTEEQFLTMSVKQVFKVEEDSARLSVEKYKSAMDDYSKVLDKIREIVNRCATARSGVHTRYLRKFSTYLKARLDVVESFSKLPTNERLGKTSILQQHFIDFESAYKAGEMTIERLSEDKDEIAKKFALYLNDTANKEEIFTWNLDHIPKENKYADIRKKARESIRAFVVKAIRTYIERTNASVIEKMIAQMKQLTLKIKEKEAKVERFFENLKSKDSIEVETAIDVPTNHDVDDNDFDLSVGEIVAVLVTAPVWAPLGFVGMVTIAPVVLLVESIKDAVETFRFRKNMEKDMNKWTQEILQEEYNLECLKRIFGELLFKKVNSYMENFSESIRNYKYTLKHLDQEKETEVVERTYAEVRHLCDYLNHMLPK